MGPQPKLPGKWTTSKSQLSPYKDWKECVWPQNEEYQKGGLNWKGEGDTRSEVKVDESLCTIKEQIEPL